MVSPKLMRTVQHFHDVGQWFLFRIKLFGCSRSVYTSATLDSVSYQISTCVSQVLSNLVCFWRRPFYFLLESITILPTVEQPGELLRYLRYTYQIQIAHLSVRSLRNSEHFIQVKDTVTSNNSDVFTISETCLDHTVSNLEVEILAMMFIELIANLFLGDMNCNLLQTVLPDSKALI